MLLQRNVPEILSNIRLLGRLTGVPERGEQVAGSAARPASTRSTQRVAGRKTPSVIMITGRLGNGLLLVTRPGTYTGDAMVRAGGRFRLRRRHASPQVSPEAIFNADPDVLLFAGNEKDMKELIAPARLARYARRARPGRAHAVSRAELLIPGPRTIDGIERLADDLPPAGGAAQ